MDKLAELLKTENIDNLREKLKLIREHEKNLLEDIIEYEEKMIPIKQQQMGYKWCRWCKVHHPYSFNCY